MFYNARLGIGYACALIKQQLYCICSIHNKAVYMATRHMHHLLIRIFGRARYNWDLYTLAKRHFDWLTSPNWITPRKFSTYGWLVWRVSSNKSHQLWTRIEYWIWYAKPIYIVENATFDDFTGPAHHHPCCRFRSLFIFSYAWTCTHNNARIKNKTHKTVNYQMYRSAECLWFEQSWYRWLVLNTCFSTAPTERCDVIEICSPTGVVAWVIEMISFSFQQTNNYMLCH